MKLHKLIIILSFIAICSPAITIHAGEFRNQATLYRKQGLLAQEEGDLEKALLNFTKAKELDPTWPVIYNDLGIIYEEKNMLSLAENMFLKALRLDETYPSAYSNLALLYEKKQEQDKANYCWRKRAALGAYEDKWTNIARQRIGQDNGALMAQDQGNLSRRERDMLLEMEILPEFEQGLAKEASQEKELGPIRDKIQEIANVNPCDDKISYLLETQLSQDVKNQIKEHTVRYHNLCQEGFVLSAKDEVNGIAEIISRHSSSETESE